MKLEQICKAPEVGRAMIYFQTSLYYGAYKRIGEEILLDDNRLLPLDFLELHLFDSKTEYRAVLSKAHNLTGISDYIEVVISDEMQDYDEKIKEECFLESEYIDEKIGVMNYMKFDENDLLHLVNYRLYQVEGGNNGE